MGDNEQKQGNTVDDEMLLDRLGALSIKGGKKGIVTIGRWQPPHSGHSNLIGVVIRDVVRERKAGKNTVGYIYVSPRPDETRGGLNEFHRELSSSPANVNPSKKLGEILSKNPLTQIQKWYYLNLMYPILPTNVKFLMVEYPTNRTIASFLLDGFVKESNFEWNQYGKEYEYNIRGTTIPEFVSKDNKYSKNYSIMKMLYRRKQQILQENRLKWQNKTQKIISKHQEKRGRSIIPSLTCIRYLKNGANVKQIEIVVGSDRVQSFTRFNQPALDELEEGGSVRQAGRDRGSVGDGMIVEPVKRELFSLDNSDQERIVEKAFASCSSMEDKDGHCGGEEERDGVFSGTILRDCVKALKCNVESKGSERPLDYFIRGVLVGNMTPMDAFCLFIDIALNLGYSAPSIEQYNNLVSDKYKVSYEVMTGGRKRKTRKRRRVPIKYVPKRLTRKDKKKARKELKKSRKAYKKGKYYKRKRLKSFKSKKSNHIVNAMKIYGVKSVSASPKLAKKSGCSVTGLKKLVSKGAGAYYSSGSRPNQTAISWGRARMASAITGGKAAAVDFKILEKYCKSSSKALKLAKKAKKKHGYGTRKVRKVKL